jgi:metal-dependent amidase/aminoacylase/carboxypeptidase family protein
MPVAIDHVDSEVIVEGGHGREPAESSRRTLPDTQAVQRWRALLRQEQWDHERTSAIDYDHGD